MARELTNSNVLCEQCNKTFNHIGQHWSKGQSCSHPPISEDKMEILTGVLMGDGSIYRSGKNPYMAVQMITHSFLHWLDRKLGWVSTGTSLHRTAAESAKKNRSSGFRPDAEEENYSDMYRLITRRHPQLQELAEWYSSGEKVFPDDVALTPTILKMWYVSDGGFVNTGGHRHIELSMSNERGNREKIKRYFSDIGVSVGNWNEWEEPDTTKGCKAAFHVKETQQLFEYMGDPPPGFEYKWPGDWNYGKQRPLPAVQQ